ncbi:unnamed protein product [Ostreobium quekettii]|uniref:Bromo domain-containing protein n=1 Tax=Ostreobium quekettii TaxID=121088 RepID=A0A8S1J1P6_9CHLO|nr:unnamed protein product [Ostreobium quekettii]
MLEAQKTMLEARIRHLRRLAPPGPASEASKHPPDPDVHSSGLSVSSMTPGGVKRANQGAPGGAKAPKRARRPSPGRAEVPRGGQAVRDDDPLAQCRKILSKLKKQSASRPFRQPVDPVLQQCPNYYEVVRHPMDLGTVGERLGLGRDAGKRYADPLEFRDDVRQIFANCRVYNPHGHVVRKMGEKLSEKFEALWAEAGIERAWEARGGGAAGDARAENRSASRPGHASTAPGNDSDPGSLLRVQSLASELARILSKDRTATDAGQGPMPFALIRKLSQRLDREDVVRRHPDLLSLIASQVNHGLALEGGQSIDSLGNTVLWKLHRAATPKHS